MPESSTAPGRAFGMWWGVVAAFVVGTLGLGAWLRWALAGVGGLPVPFADLRHAHSHLGYFGVLFPLAWAGLATVGVVTPGPRWRWFYALSTVVAVVGFVTGGYGPVAIAGCTAVAVVWGVHAVALRGHMRRLRDPVGAVPLGVLLSLACVPPVAVFLRSDPPLALGFVSTFLAGLLLAVLVPAALASRRISPGPWPFLLAMAALSALALGVAPTGLTRVGLLAFGGLLLVPAWSPRLPLHLRTVWAAVALGLVALALGLLPNTRPVALGAIHFLVLGPVLGSLAPVWLRRNPPDGVWWVGHLTWATMAAALVAQGLGAGAWTWTVAAVGGTATLVWWVGVMVFQLPVFDDDQTVDTRSTAEGPVR